MTATEKFERLAGRAAGLDDLRGRSVRGALWMAVGSAGDFVLRLVSVSVLARLVAPEHFGLLAMITAVTAIAGQISTLGLGTATVQRRELDHAQATGLFWINTGFGLALALVLCGVAPAISGFYHDARLLPITLAASVTFLVAGLGVQHDALLTRQMKQAQSAIIRLASLFLSVVLGIVLALRGYGYWALVWPEVVRTALLVVGAWICCPWVPGLPTHIGRVGGLVRFGTNVTLAQLLNGVVSNLDRLLLGRYFGADPVGFYRQAQQLMMTPIDQLNTPIQAVSQPGLSLLQDDSVRYRRYYQTIVLAVALLTMPLAAFAVVYPREITLLVLGPSWVDAAPILGVFAIAAFVRPVLGTAGLVMITLGKSKRLLRFSWLRNATLLLCTVVGIRWGARGVAIAQLTATLILMVPNLRYAFQGSPISMRVFFEAIHTPLVASLAMAVGLFLLHFLMSGAGTLVSLASGACVGAAVFLAACLVPPRARKRLTVLAGEVNSALRAARPAGADHGPGRTGLPSAGTR